MSAPTVETLDQRVTALECSNSNLTKSDGVLDKLFTEFHGIRESLVRIETTLSLNIVSTASSMAKQDTEISSLKSKVNNIELKMASAAGAGAVIAWLLTRIWG